MQYQFLMVANFVSAHESLVFKQNTMKGVIYVVEFAICVA